MKYNKETNIFNHNYNTQENSLEMINYKTASKTIFKDINENANNYYRVASKAKDYSPN